MFGDEMKSGGHQTNEAMEERSGYYYFDITPSVSLSVCLPVAFSLLCSHSLSLSLSLSFSHSLSLFLSLFLLRDMFGDEMKSGGHQTNEAMEERSGYYYFDIPPLSVCLSVCLSLSLSFTLTLSLSLSSQENVRR